MCGGRRSGPTGDLAPQNRPQAGPSVAGSNQRLAEHCPARWWARSSSATRCSVAWTQAGVTASARSGEVRGERCVIAVPASVTGSIQFERRSLKGKREALEGVSMGCGKLFVPLPLSRPSRARFNATGPGPQPGMRIARCP